MARLILGRDFIVTLGRYDLGPKRHVYAEAGVKEFWLVYPDSKRVDVFHLQENPDAPIAAYELGKTFGSVCFPGLEFRTDEIFRAR